MSSMFERMVEWRNWMRNAGFSSREREGYSGPELRAIRAAKGVGRPATVTLARRFRAGIRVTAREMTKNMLWQAWRGTPIFLPPATWLGFTRHVPMIDSTAALRKSKRRRGKG